MSGHGLLGTSGSYLGKKWWLNIMVAKYVAKYIGASILSLGLLLSLGACNSSMTAGKDAVASGGDFQIYAPDGQKDISYPPEERKILGELRGPSLLDEGKEISLADFPDKVVILNTWGQWCGPCRTEVDDLQGVQDRLGDRGTVLGINVRDNVKEKAQDFVKDNHISYPSIYDPPFKTSIALGGIPATVIPTTIVLDKEHRPAHVFLRAIEEEELWKVVEPLLEENQG